MKDYQTLFIHIQEVQVPTALKDCIFRCIDKEAKRQARLRFTFFTTVATSSFTALFFLSVSLFNNLIQSGSYNYASLLFSDIAAVSKYWKEFSLSFVESLPILGIIVFLSVTIVFLWTSAKALGTIRRTSLIVN